MGDLVIDLARVAHVALHLLSVGLLLLLFTFGLLSSPITKRVNLVHIVLVALILRCLRIFTVAKLNLALIHTLLRNFGFLGKHRIFRFLQHDLAAELLQVLVGLL